MFLTKSQASAVHFKHFIYLISIGSVQSPTVINLPAAQSQKNWNTCRPRENMLALHGGALRFKAGTFLLWGKNNNHWTNIFQHCLCQGTTSLDTLWFLNILFSLRSPYMMIVIISLFWDSPAILQTAKRCQYLSPLFHKKYNFTFYNFPWFDPHVADLKSVLIYKGKNWPRTVLRV